MPYATASDVIDRWIGPSAPADSTQVDLFIADAETMIAREFPTLADNIDNDDYPTTDQVKLVVVAMVTRLYRNPEGIRSRSIGGPDDFGGSVTYAGSNPGALTISDDERTILTGPAITQSGPFAIDTAWGTGDIHGETCALRFGADYCSCGADIAGYPLYEILP